MQIKKRILALRKWMTDKKLDAYIVPSTDPHQSEYVAERWLSRAWLSGFTGSAGIVVVTQNHAGLWTDSRYFIQAEQELENSGIELHKQGIPHAPEHIGWLAENLKAGSVLGCDGTLFSVSQIRHLNKRLYPYGIEVNNDFDLVDLVWKDRPALPTAPIFEHDLAFAGKSRSAKMDEVSKAVREKGADFYFIPTLDDIAWLLNIRGRDVDYNPVVICYFVLGAKQSYLFIEKEKVSEELTNILQGDGIFIKPYTAIASFLETLPEGAQVLIDPGSISIQLFKKIPDQAVLKGGNIIRKLKAIKSDEEVAHIRKAMLKDGVALTKLYRWLDAQLESRSVSEVEVSAQLATFRSQQAHYYGESFGAIVGYKGNGAMAHYRPEEGKCAHIKKEGMLLIDSGGQYEDGTTDITRTTTLGPPTAEQKRNYTLVLKGHIALATIQFPKGTKGMQLDTLARMHLWNDGLNYGHGTGHGVGYFLNVHEPPQGFATNPSTSRGTTALQEGMFTSNEPGFYKTGDYGIRIENLLLCVAGEKTDFGQFLKFESLTLFPIATNLIELELLSEADKNWLNSYHEEVFEKLAPLLDEEEKEWMRLKCQAV